jgi:hypothetical protein
MLAGRDADSISFAALAEVLREPCGYKLFWQRRRRAFNRQER